VQNGAHVVRVHDVRDTVSALRVLAAMQAQG
jgi:dihydropteroate synthase